MLTSGLKSSLTEVVRVGAGLLVLCMQESGEKDCLGPLNVGKEPVVGTAGGWSEQQNELQAKKKKV